MNDIRLFVFRDLIKCKYNPPPKKFVNKNKQVELGGNDLLDSGVSSIKKMNSKQESSDIKKVIV